jgi:hypothetical protein
MKRVLVLSPPGFEAYEAMAFADVIEWARKSWPQPIGIVTSGTEPRLSCTFQDYVIQHIPLWEVDVASFDALAVPRAPSHTGQQENTHTEIFASVIRDFVGHSKPTISARLKAEPWQFGGSAPAPEAVQLSSVPPGLTLRVVQMVRGGPRNRNSKQSDKAEVLS